MINVKFIKSESAKAGEMIQLHNWAQADIIYTRLYNILQLGSYGLHSSKGCFSNVFSGLTPNDVLGILYNKVTCNLNNCDSEQAIRTIGVYKKIERDFGISNSILDTNIDYNEIVAYRRLGKYSKALSLCDKMLAKELNSYVKVKVLITKGSLETDESRQIFGINSLSLALAEAEANGTTALIAECYIEINKMIGTHYPSLGLSFLWKALILYETEHDNGKISLTKSRMALTYFLLWHQKKDDRFIDEARRLVNNEIKREDFAHPGAQYAFDRTKGLITNNVSLLEKSIDFFEGIHAYGEIFITAELLIKTYLDLGNVEEAKKNAVRFEQAALAINDTFRLNYIRSINWDNVKSSWIPEQKQKTLPDLLDVLEHLAYEEEWFHLEKNAIRALFPTHYQDGKFTAVMYPDGKAHLYPCALYPNRYFRGQSDKLEGKACKPSLFRNLPEEEIFRERLYLKEFENLLQNYPLTKVFNDMLYYNTPEGPKHISLKVDYTALAQHYGIKTDLLDLTADKWVAAFFASTTYKNGEYVPFESEGEGAFYIYQHMPVFDVASDRLSAVGLQPLSRPGCQAGLVYKMLKNEDFNKKAQRIVFKHDPDISKLIFNYCNRSKKLFPNEILENKANEIRESKVYSQVALTNTISAYYKDTDESVIQGYIDQLGITIQNDPSVSFSPQEITAVTEKYDQEKDHYFDSVIIIPTIKTK